MTDVLSHGSASDVVMLVNGAPLASALLRAVAHALDSAALSIAVDGGLVHADRAGRTVDVVIGDLDSVEERALDRARSCGSEIIEYPKEKDATDLDLALQLVDERWTGPERPRVLLIGGHGGRTDHLLGNLLTLCAPRHERLDITVWAGDEVITVIRGSAVLQANDGRRVSLLAVHGPVTGITTSGLRYALTDATLASGSSRGISNEFLTHSAEIVVGGGVLLAIQSSDP